jgi:hypothetical protein
LWGCQYWLEFICKIWKLFSHWQQTTNTNLSKRRNLIFSDGKYLKVDEFVNNTLSCAIALEDLNSFIITGGVWIWQR